MRIVLNEDTRTKQVWNHTVLVFSNRSSTSKEVEIIPEIPITINININLDISIIEAHQSAGPGLRDESRGHNNRVALPLPHRNKILLGEIHRS